MAASNQARLNQSARVDHAPKHQQCGVPLRTQNSTAHALSGTNQSPSCSMQSSLCSKLAHRSAGSLIEHCSPAPGLSSLALPPGRSSGNVRPHSIRGTSIITLTGSGTPFRATLPLCTSWTCEGHHPLSMALRRPSQHIRLAPAPDKAACMPGSLQGDGDATGHSNAGRQAGRC